MDKTIDLETIDLLWAVQRGGIGRTATRTPGSRKRGSTGKRATRGIRRSEATSTTANEKVLGVERNEMEIIRDDRGQIIGFVKGEIVQDARGRIVGYVRPTGTYDATNRRISLSPVPGMLLNAGSHTGGQQ
jgi:hypothetical protein